MNHIKKAYKSALFLIMCLLGLAGHTPLIAEGGSSMFTASEHGDDGSFNFTFVNVDSFLKSMDDHTYMVTHDIGNNIEQEEAKVAKLLKELNDHKIQIREELEYTKINQKYGNTTNSTHQASSISSFNKNCS